MSSMRRVARDRSSARESPGFLYILGGAQHDVSGAQFTRIKAGVTERTDDTRLVEGFTDYLYMAYPQGPRANIQAGSFAFKVYVPDQKAAENKVADILNNMYHQGISYTQIQGADGRMKGKMHSDQPFGKIGYNLLAKKRCRELLALIAREFATENRVWGIRRVLEVDERPRRWQR